MKIKYIVALLAIILVIGCATTQKPEAPETPPAAPETPPAPPEAPETPPAAPEAPASVNEVAVTKAGFNPNELTVKVGSTITLKAVEGNHKFTIGGKSTQLIAEGSAYDAKMDKAEKVQIFDIFTKKSAVVTVTE